MKSLALLAFPAALLAAGAALAQSNLDQGGSPAAAPAAVSSDSRNDNPTARSMTDALNTMEAKGLGAFSNFHQSGDGSAAAQVTAPDGRQNDVTLDPNNPNPELAAKP
jgi:hypothetical protein